MIYKVLYIPGGAGILPSTVCYICPNFHTCQVQDFRNSRTHGDTLRLQHSTCSEVVAIAGIFHTKKGFKVLNHHERDAYPMIP